MSRLIPMSDLVADDLLLDRLAAREHPGSEPVAGLLAALADQADTPLPSRAGRRRIAHKHRYLGPFAVLVVAASGAGVAAAVTLPHHAPDPADKARVVRQMEAAARSDAPSALLSRLGLPRTTGATDAQGLVMARRDDGVIVLVPAVAAVVQGGASDAGGTPDGTAPNAARAGATAPGDGAGRGGAGRSAGGAGPSGGGRDGSPATGNSQGGTGNSQGGTEQGSGASGAPAGSHTVAPQPSSTGNKQGDGGQGSGSQSTGSTSSTAGTSSKGGQRPTSGSTATGTPKSATTPTLIPTLAPDTMVVGTTSPTTPPTP